MNTRYFLAIIPPFNIRQKISRTMQATIERDNNLRSVTLENLHITLIFLGTIEKVKEIQKISGEILAEISTFRITLNGLGLFPNKRRPKIIWIEIKDGTILEKINLSLFRKFTSAGFSLDDRPFSPHLSLVRLKKYDQTNRNKARKIVEKNRQLIIGTFLVDEIYLVESNLEENGPKYNIIKTYKLKEK